MIKVRKYAKRGVKGWEVDINVRLPTGEVIRERVKSPATGRAASERWAREREAQIFAWGGREPKATIEKAQPPTVEGFAERFLVYSRTNNKPSTVLAKEVMLRVHLLPFFGTKRLDEIGPADIESFKARKLDEGQSKKSINNHLTGLRKLLNLAAEWEVIPRAPKVKGFGLRLQPVGEDEFLTIGESARLLEAAAPEWRSMLTIALATGLRVGELLGLRWEDIDLVAGQLVVRRTLWRGQEGPPKGGRHRPVPLSATALATLKAHRHLRGPYVFCEADGARLTAGRVKSVVPAACKRAGLAKRITWHGLRHSFASQLVARGAPLKAVQELLGHESIEMTLRYSHLTPDVRRDTVRLLDLPAPDGAIEAQK